MVAGLILGMFLGAGCLAAGYWVHSHYLKLQNRIRGVETITDSERAVCEREREKMRDSLVMVESNVTTLGRNQATLAQKINEIMEKKTNTGVFAHDETSEERAEALLTTYPDEILFEPPMPAEH